MSQRYNNGYHQSESGGKKKKKKKKGPTGWGLLDNAAKKLKGRKMSLDEKIKAAGG